MPVVTMTFNLPEEEAELRTAMDAARYAGALDEVREAIRNKLKYTPLSDAEAKAWSDIQDTLHQAVEGLLL